jgi:hypothetical protein
LAAFAIETLNTFPAPQEISTRGVPRSSANKPPGPPSQIVETSYDFHLIGRDCDVDQ